MATQIRFPQGPIADESGYVTLEWSQWLQNPQFMTISFAASLGVSGGGTGLSSGTSGGILAFTSATTMASSGTLTLNGPVLGGGAGGVPTSMAAGMNGQLVIGQTGLAPAWVAMSGDATLAATGAITISKTNGANFTSYATAVVGQLLGTATNDDAASGNIGEYPTPGSVARGSAVALTNNTAANVTSISLTAGDWDVWSHGYFLGNAATTLNYAEISISLTSNTPNGANGAFGNFVGAGVAVFAFSDVAVSVPMIRISLAANATVYAVAKAGFAINTCSAYGIIQARRRR